MTHRRTSRTWVTNLVTAWRFSQHYEGISLECAEALTSQQYV